MMKTALVEQTNGLNTFVGITEELLLEGQDVTIPLMRFDEGKTSSNEKVHVDAIVLPEQAGYPSNLPIVDKVAFIHIFGKVCAATL